MFLLAERRRQVEAAAAAIADDLDFNAEAVALTETGGKTPGAIQGELLLDGWTAHRATLHALEKKTPGLWGEVSEAFNGLSRTELRATTPPPAGPLRELAERLRQVRF